MNPCGFDPAHGLDGAFEFAFEGALIIHLVVKIAGGPVGLIEEFKAKTAAAGHTLRSNLKARSVQLIGGDSTDLPSGESW